MTFYQIIGAPATGKTGLAQFISLNYTDNPFACATMLTDKKNVVIFTGTRYNKTLENKAEKLGYEVTRIDIKKSVWRVE